MSTEAWRISIGLILSVGGIILATKSLNRNAFSAILTLLGTPIVALFVPIRCSLLATILLFLLL